MILFINKANFLLLLLLDHLEEATLSKARQETVEIFFDQHYQVSLVHPTRQ